MADKPDAQVDGLDEAELPGDEAAAGGKLWLAVMAAVVLVGAGGGYAAALLVRGSPRPQHAQTHPAPEKAPAAEGGALSYHDFDPITVNLDDPRLARYVRATVTLAAAAEHKKPADEAIKQKLPELRNWLTVYLSGCSLDDLRGPKNLNRIRREVLDSFNALLWPNGKGLIKEVLFKEFAVQ